MSKEKLISIGIWISDSIITILLNLVILLVVVLFPFDRKRKIAHSQCFWWSDCLIALNPYWNLTISGLENIDKKKTYVIVANHQSLADIVVLYKIKMQFKWVAKSGLLKVPFINAMLLLCKHIMLRRGKFSSIKQVYREAAQWLRSGVSVLFFPEGTRSETDEMNEFQIGAFKLAIKEHVPVLPISIKGTRDAIPRGSWVFKAKIHGSLTVLPPIDTSQFKASESERLSSLARSMIEGA